MQHFASFELEGVSILFKANEKHFLLVMWDML